MKYQPTRMRLDYFTAPSRQRRRKRLRLAVAVGAVLAWVWRLGVV